MSNFPEVVSSSLISTFKSCALKARYTHFDHWAPRTSSVHLHAGGAFATALEAARRAHFIDGKPPAEAVGIGAAALIRAYGDYEPPADSPKSLEAMLGALDFYFDRWPLGQGAVPHRFSDTLQGIEFSFLEPLPITHPQTGNDILFSGRADQIVDYAGGIYIEDDKTTSSLGASWPRQWTHRSQFSSYTWAAHRAGIPSKGVLVRGVAILKTKYEAQEVLTTRSSFEVERWYISTLKVVSRMVAAWLNDDFEPDLDDACSAYGGCQYLDVCKSPNPDEWLPLQFVRRAYDPITRQELPL
jgi:hypothetical protein